MSKPFARRSLNDDGDRPSCEKGMEMSITRTELGDLSAVGTELDESALLGIHGGQRVEVSMGTYIDPPGVCCAD